MKIHTIVHNDIEKIGVIEDWIAQSSFEMTQTRTYRGEMLPQVESGDMVIIMGGEQSVRNLEAFPYLKDEIAFVQEAAALGCPIFGVCLGAQLIAAALGGRVVASPEKEMGVYPISMTQEARHNPIFGAWPEELNVFHWHFDMAELPEGARLHARSAGCPVQAFSIGPHIYGFQFHLELNHARAKALVKRFSKDLENPGPYTKSVEEVLNADFDQMNSWLLRFLDRWMLSALVSQA